MNPQDPSEERRGYNRPNDRWTCGRAAAWGTPCPLGPDYLGACGGTQECRPVRVGAHLRCNRAADAGGPCTEGPTADGACSQLRPPCQPRASLRVWRGRVAMTSAALVFLALVAGIWHPFDPAQTGPSLDPGPLSAAHAQFIGGANCAACHGAAPATVSGLLRAGLAHGDLSPNCIACHRFAGPALSPHQETWASTRGPSRVECTACHTEHHGTKTLLTHHTDQQCHACHQQPFARFDRGHPPFPDLFPARRSGLRFDHASHLEKHFTMAEHRDRGFGDCRVCHLASPGSASLGLAPYSTGCAPCHDAQITDNEFALLRFPDPVPASDDDSVLAEDNTAAMRALLAGSDGSFGKNWRQLLTEFVEAGPATLSARATHAPSPQITAGLSRELVAPASSRWLGGAQFAPAAGDPTPGWYWFDDLYPELRYRPTGHGDAVVRAWIELAIHPASANAERGRPLAGELLNPSTGAGRCAKCHELDHGGAAWPPGWTASSSTARPHTRFSHGAHLGIQSCADCHKLGRAPARAPGGSSFRSVSLASCATCHTTGRIRSDCHLCHSYHPEHRLAEPLPVHASSDTAVLGTAMQARQEPDSTVTPGSRR